MTLSEFGEKVLNFFITNSENEGTILFVLDYDTYSSFFENEQEREEFEIKIKEYVQQHGLKFNNDKLAICLAAHQVLLAYEKIKKYLKEDTDRAINDAISSFYEFKNNQIYDSYYHKYSNNDNKNLWEAVYKIFKDNAREINLPTSGFEYVKYPNEQIKFYRIFKNDEFNSLFSTWINSDVTCLNQIYSDRICGDLLFKYFCDSNMQTVITTLWAYYLSWKKSTILSEDDKGLYIELYDDKLSFRIAGDVFNRKKNQIIPTEKRLYKVFEHDSGFWWRASKNDIPCDGEFVLLVDKNYEEKFPSNNCQKYNYVEDDCDFIVYKYKKRPDNFQSEFPTIPMLIGGVRLWNNQYLDIPWLLPINNDELKYTKVKPTFNKDDTLLSMFPNIEGLKIGKIENQRSVSKIEIPIKAFEEKPLISEKNIILSEQEEAVLKCQQALFLWLATKGKASHHSIHNVCLNLIENFPCLSENDYPEYYIFQPLFKAGVVELYKTKEGKEYYALAKGGNFSAEGKVSYWEYNNSVDNSKENIALFFNSLPSIENSFYKLKDLFEEQRIGMDSSVFVRYSTKFSWADGSYESKYSTIYKNPSIFKTDNKIYAPTYFCDSNGRTFILKDDYANPWYPISWNICESYIDFKKEKILFRYDKNRKKLVCTDFTALPIYFARALICNDPEKLKDPSLWLSYFSTQYKAQEFNNVDEKLYTILKNKYVEKRDTENVLIKTNQKEKTFSFKGIDYKLPEKESYRIFRFRVEENISCWHSDVDIDGVPENRPFGLLIDQAYGSGYISYTDAKVYSICEKKRYDREPLFIVYNRLPNDFFEKLKKYKIKTMSNHKFLLDLPLEKRNKISSTKIDGLSPDIREISFDEVDIINEKHSFIINGKEVKLSTENSGCNVKFMFGEWIKDLDISEKIAEIENVVVKPKNSELSVYEIVSFQVKDVKICEAKSPLSSNKEEWNRLLQEGKKPWEYLGFTKTLIKPKSLIGKNFIKPLENIKLDSIYCNEERIPVDEIFSTVFELQEKLYKWLGKIENASLAEIHEFLMRELEEIDSYSFYGINPESKILKPLIYTGIIDCREYQMKTYYTLSKSKRILGFNENVLQYDYQKHFSGGKNEYLDNDDVLSYLLILLADKKLLINWKEFKKLELIYDEKEKLLFCSNINYLPWQLARALIMMDISVIKEKEIYLSGCKEYSSILLKNISIEKIFLIDDLISKIKQK